MDLEDLLHKKRKEMSRSYVMRKVNNSESIRSGVRLRKLR